jgi:hypothetical protein
MPPTRDPAAARAASLEQQIRELRSSVRAASRRKDAAELASVRSRLRAVQREWNAVLDEQARKSGQRPGARDVGRTPRGAKIGSVGANAKTRPTVPAREQVFQSLTLLGAPAAPRLVATVHDAFFGGLLLPRRFSSLRRDEQRSYTKLPDARPYYVCAALNSDGLTTVRGLLAVSTWPLEQRIIGPLSPRVDFLTHAIAIAERVRETRKPTPTALRLLQRFAQNIPGAVIPPGDSGEPDPRTVIRSAQSELEVHAASDRATRRAAAARARKRLDDARQLFG